MADFKLNYKDRLKKLFFSKNNVKNSNYQQRLENVIPGGAHTYSRGSDTYPRNAPQILTKGKGSYIWDGNGNKFLDFGMSLRAVTIGYAHRPVIDAAFKQALNGNNLTRPSMIELESAELIRELMPWMEMVKFAKNGSNVTTAAIKLSRAYTGKKMVARCLQQPFFSFDDWFISDTAMDSGTVVDSDSKTVNFNFNDIESVEKIFTEYPNQISCVILEPATTEVPKENFLHKVQELCKKNNAVFIIDEMITGFRWDLKGACHYYNIHPDLATYGKAMANGFSVAALGGKKEIMELGGINHKNERVFLLSSTHGAEMCSLGAFVETVNQYKKLNVIDEIKYSGNHLIKGFNEISSSLDLQDHFQMIGTPYSPNYITRNSNGDNCLKMRTLFSQEMINNKVLMPWVAMSYSHQKKERELAFKAAENALKVYKMALKSNVDDYLIGESIKPVFRKYN
ncbi:MAG: glutamate-1-semialdehyde 2,1-aminomutase [Flavobacteriaceae bacterium]|nr:glutamate-1-semialdehyde 2,1-aminomutase [Flavobacteriaceae bacterium]